MTVPLAAFTVALNGYAMHLRPSELDAVAAGLAEVYPSWASDPRALAATLAALPMNDRAATWELSIRRFAGRKPIPEAAAEIGMDAVRAEQLIARFDQQLLLRSRGA